MALSVNPTIDLSVRNPVILYMDDGTAVFPCLGNPEGVIVANRGSIACDRNSGDLYRKTTNNVSTGWVAIAGGGGGGVSSVGLALPGEFAISGSPVTSSGTLTGAWNNQLANRVFAGPNTGAPATPAFRALVAADIPGLAAGPTNAVQINNGSNAFDGSAGFTFDPLSNTASLGQSVLPGHLRLLAAGGFYNDFVTQTLGSNIFWLLPSAIATTTNQALTVSSLPGGGQIGLSWASPWTGVINATDGALPYRSSASQFSDSPLFRESANVIAQRNGVNAQGYQVYNTTDAGLTNYERLSLSWVSNEARIQTQQAGTGVNRQISFLINSVETFRLWTQSTSLFTTGIRYTAGSGGAEKMRWSNSGSYSLQVGSDVALSASSTTDSGAPGDVSLIRHAVNIWRIGVGPGTSNQGKLFIGNSAGTSFGQLHVESINTSTVCAFFATQSGASSISDLLQGQNGSTQIFKVTAGGKVVGNSNQVQAFNASGVIAVDTTVVGNVGTSPTNLHNRVIPANTLSAAGDTYTYEGSIEFANTGGNKKVTVTLGSATIYDSGTAQAYVGRARLVVTITRLTATSQLTTVAWLCNDTVVGYLTDYQVANPTENLATALTLAVVATGGATNDVRQHLSIYGLKLN